VVANTCCRKAAAAALQNTYLAATIRVLDVHAPVVLREGQPRHGADSGKAGVGGKMQNRGGEGETNIWDQIINISSGARAGGSESLSDSG
jgi:hypothetical protein